MWNSRKTVLALLLILVLVFAVSCPASAQVTRSGSKLTSETDTSIPFYSVVADDFIASGSVVTTVTIYGGSWPSGGFFPSTFEIRFYSDLSCLPDVVVVAVYVTTAMVTTTFDRTDTDGLPIYKNVITLPTPFYAVVGQQWWCSVRAGDHLIGDQWGVDVSAPLTGCDAAFQSVLLGYPNWTPQSLVPEERDVRMEIGYETPLPVRETSWSRIRGMYR
jgi:hypothetical protein